MLATLTAWIVVALHLLFFLAETVGWTQMARRFGYTREATAATKTLALNQGFYNAGLAAVLAWSLLAGQPATTLALLVYVIAMSIVGAVSVRWTIFVLQGIPALIALAVRLL